MRPYPRVSTLAAGTPVTTSTASLPRDPATVAARNANATRGLMELEADPGDQVPTASAIRLWATQWNWAARADYELGDTTGMTMRELERKYRAIMLGGADVLLRAQTGGYKGRELEGALAVKATEVGMKVIKDGFVLAQPEAEKPQIHAKVLTREEEAAINSQMIRRHKER